MLDAETIENIAEKAADRAIEKMTAQVYQDIGRGIVSKLFWLCGVVLVGLAFWLASKGAIKP
ncbi:MAG: hypothetical protein P4L87_25245 [Formivibrio sp.]|nr:hypothetical protein [Formivibrio sp.]